MLWFFPRTLSVLERAFDGAIRNQGALLGLELGLSQTTGKQYLEGFPEALGHEGIDDRVEGTVQVDAEATEEKEAPIQIGLAQKRVDHHQGPVGQPQQSKENHHHCQHLGDLQDKRETIKCMCPHGSECSAPCLHQALCPALLSCVSSENTDNPYNCIPT